MDIISKGMKDIAIYGAGGLGREIACLIKMINESQSAPRWNHIGFFDDNPELRGTSNEYGAILGGFDMLNCWTKPIDIAMAIGNPTVVKKITENITNKNVDYPNIFAPNTLYLDKENITFGRGNVVCLGCIFSCNVRVGDFNVFNGLITVGHDAKIGNYNSLMPSVRISGEVIIGDENFFGCASVVLQQVMVGCKTTVGAGSVVMRKTKDCNTYIGNPASLVKY